MRYTAGSDFAAVELPYVGEQLSMLLVVPNAGQFESVRKAASAQWLKSVLSGAADFTGISADEPLQIGDVIQKAFIAVDENATEAAAATAVIGAVVAASTDVVQLYIDRPFLFFIRDESGVVLFSGHVIDPSESQ